MRRYQGTCPPKPASRLRVRLVGEGGFTLIELLVSIILMIILLSAVTLIFVRTTETVAVSQARTTVYTNARYALDIMENDLLGSLPFTSGQQRFILENGRTAVGGAGPVSSMAGFHVCTPTTGGAADLILFRTTTAAGNTIQTCEVSYHLIQGNMALPGPVAGVLPTLPATAGLLPGDPTRGQTQRPPIRPLYTLVRRTRTQNTTNPATYDQIPRDSNNQLIPDTELCYFVLSFNIEYLSNNMSFSQLDAGPGLIGNSPCPPTDPLGNGDVGGGTNDGGVGGVSSTPLRIPFIRVTMVIIEGEGARQEREIQKTIWIPMG